MRMIYAASKDALKTSLIGIKRELEANDLEEIEEEERPYACLICNIIRNVDASLSYT
ncbi:Cofilin [Trichinella pseudospiralis]|uniref:Cofilin n=1 Tax=Trichinella pseudospiralis TaxID=6337 RepID=A0A0V0WTP0_TRIPS|nr:Cofilin [Trichinella pseudospiralis]